MTDTNTGLGDKLAEHGAPSAKSTSWEVCPPCMSTTRHDRDATGVLRCYLDPRHPHFATHGGRLPEVADGYAKRIAAHREALRLDGVEPRTTLVYLIEGEPTTGDLTKYAHDVVIGGYSGCEVSTTVWLVHAGTLHAFTPTFEGGAYNEDDLGTLVVTLTSPMGEEEASATIDGRA